ncbi:MAG: hypothetical protein KGQ60_13825, partial [Planctomycetes bacterium]|nr:hypothetical protein [Planctomycetota bacterium]
RNRKYSAVVGIRSAISHRQEDLAPPTPVRLVRYPWGHTLSLPAPETTSIGKCEISVCPLGSLSLG